MLPGLETCIHAYRSQIVSNPDQLFLYVHWYLVHNGAKCIVDGTSTEILPSDWNQTSGEYNIGYSMDNKGYELKVLIVEESLIVNLVKKSNERTASVGCIVADHVVDYKKPFQNSFKNLNDLYNKINTEFQPLIKDPQQAQQAKSTAPSNHSNPSNPSHPSDPLRVGPSQRPPYPPPDNYGRSDLDPFSGPLGDPGRAGLGGMGGMIFDPFRGQNRPQIPGNLPPGSVPPGSRYDPFGPTLPDDLGGGNPMRAGPNPSHFRPPQFEDPFM